MVSPGRRSVGAVVDWSLAELTSDSAIFIRGADDWKPFHHDRAAFTPDCPQNFTVAATFGPDTRESKERNVEYADLNTCAVGFQHARTHSTLFLPIPNGSAYTFSRDINIEWKHGEISLFFVILSCRRVSLTFLYVLYFSSGVIATPEDSVNNLGGRISIIAWVRYLASFCSSMSRTPIFYCFLLIASGTC